jgi:biopolymer transport protein ExbB/TolQ
VLLNRIRTALANLKNLGRVADADEILQSLAANDESGMETSYSLLHGFVWAIPVLGFIGTVQGLSQAVGGFGSVLSNSGELAQIKEALRDVTAGLAVAFETTMQGLVAALCIQLAMTAIKKSEEEFLDACVEYCSHHIVGRLRLMPFESGRDS